MVRRSTNPDDEHDDCDESLELTDQTELGRAVSEPSKQDIDEPPGSVPACGDSLVTVSKKIIIIKIIIIMKIIIIIIIIILIIMIFNDYIALFYI